MYTVVRATMPDGHDGFAVVKEGEKKARGLFRDESDAQRFIDLIREPDLSEIIFGKRKS